MPEQAALMLDMRDKLAKLLVASEVAERDRKEIKDHVARINGRIAALELWRAQIHGASTAVQTIWLALAGFVGAAAGWVAHKLGLV